MTGFCVEGVKRGVLPFLRCAALFFNCLTGVPPPEELSGTAGHYTSYVVCDCQTINGIKNNVFVYIIYVCVPYIYIYMCIYIYIYIYIHTYIYLRRIVC